MVAFPGIIGMARGCRGESSQGFEKISTQKRYTPYIRALVYIY